MNWVKRRNFLAIKAIQFNGKPYIAKIAESGLSFLSFHFLLFSIFLFSFLSYSPFGLFLVCRIRISDGRGHVIQRGF